MGTHYRNICQAKGGVRESSKKSNVNVFRLDENGRVQVLIEFLYGPRFYFIFVQEKDADGGKNDNDKE
jgi:hypothetical protein